MLDISPRHIRALEVTALGVGCNQFGVSLDRTGVEKVVHEAVDQGVRFFDTADEYGYGASEELLGRALTGVRDEVVIATKAGCRFPGIPQSGGANWRWITTAVEASLRRLGTDWIDLYQVHYWDPVTPIEETLGALDALVTAGKVREIGCCNYAADQLQSAARVSLERGLRPFASTQLHLNLLRRGALKAEIPAASAAGMQVIPYWPLASGLLTGKYRRAVVPAVHSRMARYPGAAERMLTDTNFTRLEALEVVASNAEASVLDLAIGWLLTLPSVSVVIAGATRPAQVRQNAMAASRGLRLDPSVLALAETAVAR